MFLLSVWGMVPLRMNSDGSTRFTLRIGVYDNDGWVGLERGKYMLFSYLIEFTIH